MVCSADVSIEPDVGSLFGKIQQRFGRLDLLFNNAGVSAAEAPIDELSLEQWNRVIAANLTGTFLCTREAVRMMKNQKPAGGRIINNGSLAASTPRPHSAPYAASKHAITGLTRATALDCRKYGIAVGQIDIGNAATDMAQGSATGALQPDGSILKEPLMDVQHVADAVVHMASLPLNANILFLTVMATGMPFIGRG